MFEPSRPLDWGLTPLQALARWPADRPVVLLHSARLQQPWARWSILAQHQAAYRFTTENPAQRRGQSQWIGVGKNRPEVQFTHDPFTDLRALLQATDALWIGHLAYELGAWVEPSATTAPAPHDDRHWPIIELGYCPTYLVHDGLTGQWRACGDWANADLPNLTLNAPDDTPFPTATEPKSNQTRAQYQAAVKTALDYINAGDIFQVNIAQRFTSHLETTNPTAARALYQNLAHLSPAWYGAYLESCTEPRRALASISPELFLQLDHDRVVTRPIKGTRPANIDAQQLRDSPKDTAELNMIVDLMRNDLGRVCTYGSVRVDQSREIESHPTVHHGVATITGQLHPSMDAVDLLRACFPGGSITGAPKVRAMQIIAELEPVARGPYCGCMGYLSRNQACLSMGIRTMAIDPAAQRVDFSVGAGIVADSDPEAEYNETLHKAAAMRDALKGSKQGNIRDVSLTAAVPT